MRRVLCVWAVGFALVNVAGAEEVKKSGDVAIATENDALDESVVAVENEDLVPHETNTLFRLKSGVSFPQDNSEISHIIPVTLEWEYLGFRRFSLGAAFTRMSGSSTVQNPGPDRPVGSEYQKSMGLALASANYSYQDYPIRVSAGVRAGWLFYRDSTTAPSGSVQTDMHSETRFMAGPAVNLDYTISSPFFATVGGEYLFAENAYKVGSIAVGLGAEF